MCDDIVENILKAKPLIAFSSYTAIQVDTLNETAQAIASLLDSSFQHGSIDGVEFHQVYGSFWLWVLGAYEVTRTMCQARKCFSTTAGNRICDLKRRLAKLRMPFAKQEYEGTGEPIRNEASVHGVNTSLKDLSFDVDGNGYSVRATLYEFRDTMAGIGRADVLHDRRCCHKRPSKKSKQRRRREAR